MIWEEELEPVPSLPALDHPILEMIRQCFERQNPKTFGREPVEPGPSAFNGQELVEGFSNYPISTYCDRCEADHGSAGRWQDLEG